MNKIVEYGVIRMYKRDESGIINLISQINSEIRDGWQPLGGICVVSNSGGMDELYQAIVRYSNE